jgi:hypothetical protein
LLGASLGPCFAMGNSISIYLILYVAHIYIYIHLLANGLTLSTALVMEMTIETQVRSESSRIMGEECGIKNSSF